MKGNLKEESELSDEKTLKIEELKYQMQQLEKKAREISAKQSKITFAERKLTSPGKKRSFRSEIESSDVKSLNKNKSVSSMYH